MRRSPAFPSVPGRHPSRHPSGLIGPSVRGSFSGFCCCVCLSACLLFHEIWRGWRHWSGSIECFCFCFFLLFLHTWTRIVDSREERAGDDVPFVQHHARALWEQGLTAVLLALVPCQPGTGQVSSLYSQRSPSYTFCSWITLGPINSKRKGVEFYHKRERYAHWFFGIIL